MNRQLVAPDGPGRRSTRPAAAARSRASTTSAFAADHRRHVARPALHAEDRRQGDDVSVLGRQCVERVLDGVLDDPSIVVGHGAGHGSSQQERAAAGQPRQGRHPLGFLGLGPVGGEERCGVVFVERAQRDEHRVALQLDEPAARLARHVRVVVAPRQHDHAPVDRAHQEADEKEGRGVSQVGVVEHDRQRSICGAAAEQVGNGSEAAEAEDDLFDGGASAPQHRGLGFGTDRCRGSCSRSRRSHV